MPTKRSLRFDSRVCTPREAYNSTLECAHQEKPTMEPTELQEVATRVHATYARQYDKIPLGVLWTRNAIRESPLARHVAAVRKHLYGPERDAAAGEINAYKYVPLQGLRALAATDLVDGPFAKLSHNLVDMTENSLAILQEIIDARTGLPLPQESPRRVWSQPVKVQDDAVGAILRRAASGINGRHCTKSNIGPCSSPEYAQVMHEFGLAGVAANAVLMGSWWMSMMLQDYSDWRQDYLCILGYGFYFEYNVDNGAVKGSQSPASVIRDISALWDMPHLDAELRTRRLHMLCSMDFFDRKRIHERAVRECKTDGASVWVHADRDAWRDFKALDSGGYAHWLSCVPGPAGRDDMMLSGLVNDWVDLGPDLRYGECNQSVFALTRGSVAEADLKACYQRTVWMLNASYAAPQRHVGFMICMAACEWQLFNHRHDVWRYYALAYDMCAEVQEMDLYRVANLAECYGPGFEPREVPHAHVLEVPRREYRFNVCIRGKQHTGAVMLHHDLVDAVETDIIPATMVEYQIILPLLLRRGEVDADTFLAHMDSEYCRHFASLVQSGHRDRFSRAYRRGIAAVVMETWWAGVYYAVGVGSLVEARADRIAQDRAQ